MQLAREGACFALMEQMAKKQFMWNHMISRLHRAFFKMLLLNVILCSSFAYSWQSGTNTFQILQNDQSLAAFANVGAMVDCVALPFGCFLTCLFLLFLWTFELFAQLHRHDLLWYASALSETLERSDPRNDPLPALKMLEQLVGAHLRHASDTWVYQVLRNIGTFGVVIAVLVSHLLSGNVDQSIVLLNVWLLLGSLLAIYGNAFPLASVAETFDYDVLRALNNPIVLHHAQKYFGQQFLAHLHTLHWGFRIGGVVINKDGVAKVIGAVAIACTVATSQSLLNNLSI